jgi:hypothetical protein
MLCPSAIGRYGPEEEMARFCRKSQRQLTGAVVYFFAGTKNGLPFSTTNTLMVVAG